MKKKGYYEYSNGIYPRRLWVHIGRDLDELIDSCFDECDHPDADYGGVTYDKAIRKQDDAYGVLVSFKCIKGYVDGLLLPRGFSCLRRY